MEGLVTCDQGQPGVQPDGPGPGMVWGSSFFLTGSAPKHIVRKVYCKHQNILSLHRT